MSDEPDAPDEIDIQEKQIGHWKRLSQFEIYDNPWIRLTHEEVITPSGTEGDYGVVHFKNLAIGIVALDADYNTWLVGQHRYTLDEHSWEIPMGGGPLRTDPLLSAQRELLEETGLHGGVWQQLMKLHTSNSVTDEVAYVYLAQDLEYGEQQLEDSEGDLVVRQLPFEQVLIMVERGEITDAISVAAILAVARILADE
jgi:8-oxo-dGTP pyrophosphatase MutT (NUDIX family)